MDASRKRSKKSPLVQPYPSKKLKPSPHPQSQYETQADIRYDSDSSDPMVSLFSFHLSDISPFHRVDRLSRCSCAPLAWQSLKAFSQASSPPPVVVPRDKRGGSSIYVSSPEPEGKRPPLQDYNSDVIVVASQEEVDRENKKTEIEIHKQVGCFQLVIV